MRFDQLILEYTSNDFTFGFELECLVPLHLINVKNEANTIKIEFELVDGQSLLEVLSKLSNDNEPVIDYIKSVMDGTFSLAERTAARNANLAIGDDYEVDLADMEELAKFTTINKIQQNMHIDYSIGQTIDLPRHVLKLIEKYDIERTEYVDVVETEDVDYYQDSNLEELVNIAHDDYFLPKYKKFFGEDAECESEVDRSIKSLDLNNYFGTELKPLGGVGFGVNELSNLRGFLSQCSRDGIKTNESCGFHVHFKFANMSKADAVWVGLNYLYNPNRKLFKALTESNVPGVDFVTTYSKAPNVYTSMKNDSDELEVLLKRMYMELMDAKKEKKTYAPPVKFSRLLKVLFQNKNTSYPLLHIHSDYGTFEWRGLRGVLDDGDKNIKPVIKHIYTALNEINNANETQSFELSSNIILKKHIIEELIGEYKNTDLEYDIITYPNDKESKSPFKAAGVDENETGSEMYQKMMKMYKIKSDYLFDYKWKNIILNQNGFSNRDKSDLGSIIVNKQTPNQQMFPYAAFNNIMFYLDKQTLQFKNSVIENCIFTDGKLDMTNTKARKCMFMTSDNMADEQVEELMKYNYIFLYDKPMSFSKLSLPISSPFNIVIHEDNLNIGKLSDDVYAKLLTPVVGNGYVIFSSPNIDSKFAKSKKIKPTLGGFVKYMWENYCEKSNMPMLMGDDIKKLVRRVWLDFYHASFTLKRFIDVK